MKWMGLTGGIATGKSTAANILRELGYPVIDADTLAKVAIERGTPGFAQVLQLFGPDVLQTNGEFNRSKIGRLVFSDSKKRQALEKIIHPIVRQLSLTERLRLVTEGHAIAFYDVPLLFEKNLQDTFDGVLLIYASPKTQIERLKKRNNYSEIEAKQRLAAQLSIEEKKQKTSFVIENEGSVSELKKQILSFIHQLQL